MKLWTWCWAKVDVGHKILNNDRTSDLCHNNTINAISLFVAQHVTTCIYTMSTEHWVLGYPCYMHESVVTGHAVIQIKQFRRVFSFLFLCSHANAFLYESTTWRINIYFAFLCCWVEMKSPHICYYLEFSPHTSCFMQNYDVVRKCKNEYENKAFVFRLNGNGFG